MSSPRELSVHSLPLQQRAAMLAPGTFNEQERTVQVCWTTGARTRRVDWMTGTPYDEELVVTPESVDMTRIDAGVVQVLDGHDRHSGVRAILGIVQRGWIEGGQGLAELRLSGREDLAGIVADIQGGIIRDISFGYTVERYEVTSAQDRTDGGTVALWRASRWTPYEISFVPVPADPGASTRQAEGTYACEIVPAPSSLNPSEQSMTSQSNTMTRDEQVAHIRRASERMNLPADFVEDLVTRKVTVEQAGLLMLDKAAELNDRAGGHLNISPYGLSRSNGSTSVETQLDAMSEALAARVAGGPQLERDNPYRHVRIPDMARELLELRGVRTTAMSAGQLIERALHTTGDFPNLLMATGNRVLRAAYASYSGGLKRVSRKTTNRDFRAKQKLLLGEAPTLLKVNEAGEFKRGSMAESMESYSLQTFGRIFGITRQALVNDDLDAFGDLALLFGRAAAEFEAKFLVDLVLSNPTLGDTLAVFHASHGNLATGPGSALSETSLSAGRAAMRLQKGLDGKTPIDATPAFLIVPAALETAAEKLLTSIQATKSSDVNPFGGKLELVVEPRLDAASATAWYLAASPDSIDTIEYAYLESEEGPQTMLREGWDIDGIEIKVREDFGAGVLDFRGLYKANGA